MKREIRLIWGDDDTRKIGHAVQIAMCKRSSRSGLLQRIRTTNGPESVDNGMRPYDDRMKSCWRRSTELVAEYRYVLVIQYYYPDGFEKRRGAGGLRNRFSNGKIKRCR